MPSKLIKPVPKTGRVEGIGIGLEKLILYDISDIPGGRARSGTFIWI